MLFTVQVQSVRFTYTMEALLVSVALSHTETLTGTMMVLFTMTT